MSSDSKNYPSVGILSRHFGSQKYLHRIPSEIFTESNLWKVFEVSLEAPSDPKN